MWKCPKCGRDFKNTNQDHFCGKIDSIDAYIADQHEAHHDVLQKVRAIILGAAPGAVEKIAWQMPSFCFPDPKLKGKYIIHFASFKNHLGLYPGDEGVAAFEERLDQDGYKHTKGAIQFPYARSIPYDLIEEITRWRAKQVQDNYGK